MNLGFETLVAVFSTLTGLFVIVSIVTMMAAMGTRVTQGDVRRTIREYHLAARWVLSNLIAVPLFAVLFGTVFGLSEPVLYGLLLVAVAPGAPFIPQVVALAGEDSQEAVLLTAALTLVSTVTVPLLVAGTLFVLQAEVQFSPWRYLLPLFVVLVVPLVAGAAIRAMRPELAARVQPRLFSVANATFVSALVLVAVLDIRGLLSVFAVLLGTGYLLVLALFVLATIGIGWLAGGPDPQGRRILALGTAGRNVNVALFIATSAFPASNADASIVAFAVLMLLVSVLVALYWGRHPRSDGAPQDGEAVTREP